MHNAYCCLTNERRSDTRIVTSAKEVMFLKCLSVCLSVCDQHSAKTGGRIWLKFCMRGPFRPRTNWLTFEPDPDHSPDPGSGFRPDFGLFAGYLKDFKSNFDETWHAGNARLWRASPVCRVALANAAAWRRSALSERHSSYCLCSFVVVVSSSSSSPKLSIIGTKS